MKKLFLVDGSNHAFRVQFALPPMTASDGFPTRALYGFTTLFAKVLREHRPDYVAVCFDTGKTFRNDIFPEYKGTRKEMPEDLAQQWPHFRRLVEAFGVKYLAVEGYEADDVIGTLAKRHQGDIQVYLVTGDKDFCQLVSERVRILDLMKEAEIGPDGVFEKMGVQAHQVIDLLGLVGDTSDNIPGIPGIGPKKAAQYLEKYGSLENVLANAGKIGGKTGDVIAAHADAARLSYRLATIATDAPVDLSLDELRVGELDVETLSHLFDLWEFGPVARKLLGARGVVEPSSWRVARTPAEVSAALAEARTAPLVGVDVHLGGPDPRTAELLGVAVAWGSKGAVYVPWRAPDDDLLSMGPRRAPLVAWLADPTVAKVSHDTKRVRLALAENGVAIEGIAHDTSLGDYVLAAHERQHDLAAASLRHLSYTPAGWSDHPAPPDGVLADPLVYAETHRYACEPAYLALLLHKRVDVRLDEGSRRVYETMELPLVPVLARMEQAGIAVDREHLASIRSEVVARVDEARKACFEAAGREFDVDGRKELQEILFTELNLPTQKKVTDGFSTDASVLEQLEELHPLPGRILEYRKLQKLVSTYLDALPLSIGRDGRIHTTFNQSVAATGRLSSNNPNLQNIPIRTVEGRRIREAFVAAPGHQLVSADYSQIELRLLAHFCGGGPLAQAFRDGVDVHARTASEVFGVPADQVDVGLRSAAKAINFGLVYGMSAFRLARDLGIERGQAERYIEDYFGRMPMVREWLQATVDHAHKTGAVETLFGRRRILPDIHAKQFNLRKAAEREATNMPVQGTAADLVKIAMIRVDARLRAMGGRSRLLLQVHDELLVEAPHAEVDAVRAALAEEMRGVAELVVPLEVNTAVGDNWEQAHG